MPPEDVSENQRQVTDGQKDVAQEQPVLGDNVAAESVPGKDVANANPGKKEIAEQTNQLVKENLLPNLNIGDESGETLGLSEIKNDAAAEKPIKGAGDARGDTSMRGPADQIDRAIRRDEAIESRGIAKEMVRPVGNVSKEFVDEVTDAATLIEPKMLQKLKDNGVTINAASKVTDVKTKLNPIDLHGVYMSESKQISVFENVMNKNGSFRSNNSNVFTTLHEVGHAIDNRLGGNQPGQMLSDSRELKRAIKKDFDAMNQSQKREMKQYMKREGPGELMADAIAGHILHSRTNAGWRNTENVNGPKIENLKRYFERLDLVNKM